MLMYCLIRRFFVLAEKGYKRSNHDNLAFVPSYVEESETGEQRSGPGICLLERFVYEKIRGYSSDFVGWGMEDMDFLRRIRDIDGKVESISSGIHITHCDIDRTRNYHSSSVDEMRIENRALFQKKVDANEMYGTLESDVTSAFHEGKCFYV